MKKHFKIILALLLMIACLPITVHAMNQSVTISAASADGTKVTISGTTTAAAVMVQVRDGSNNILGMQTFSVAGGSFSGDVTDLTLAADTDYKVYVADYEGGAWTIQTVRYNSTPAEPPAPEPESEPEEDSEAASEASGDAVIRSPQTGELFPLREVLGIVGVFLAGVMAAVTNKRVGKED